MSSFARVCRGPAEGNRGQSLAARRPRSFAEPVRKQTGRVGSGRVRSLPALLGSRLHAAHRRTRPVARAARDLSVPRPGPAAPCSQGCALFLCCHGLAWSLLCPWPGVPRCPWVTFLFLADQGAPLNPPPPPQAVLFPSKAVSPLSHETQTSPQITISVSPLGRGRTRPLFFALSPMRSVYSIKSA